MRPFSLYAIPALALVVAAAPAGLDAGPRHYDTMDSDSGSAAIRGPYINQELAARAMQFTCEIDQLKLDPRLARAMVWERGYVYAGAAQETYETAASTRFVLETLDSRSWKILLHDANLVGIQPSKITRPMPDLCELCYSR